MIARAARVAAWLMLPLILCAAPVGAQVPSASPSPSPVPTPIAFSARAHAQVTVTTASGAFSGTAQLGLAQRAGLTRIDVLSVASDSFPVPPIAVTAVIDRNTNTLTVWSPTTKLYRVQAFVPRAASPSPRPSASPRPTPSPSPRPAQRGTSPFAKLEVLSLTLKLAGHATKLDLPATALQFDLLVQNKGDAKPSHVTASALIADDFSFFPLSLDASLEPGTAPFSATLSYAVDELTRGAPPPASFTVPAGYKEAPSLLGVIFPSRSRGGTRQ